VFELSIQHTVASYVVFSIILLASSRLLTILEKFE